MQHCQLQGALVVRAGNINQERGTKNALRSEKYQREALLHRHLWNAPCCVSAAEAHKCIDACCLPLHLHCVWLQLAAMPALLSLLKCLISHRLPGSTRRLSYTCGTPHSWAFIRRPRV